MICVNFKPTQSKGVFVSHDAKGESLVGLPGKPAGTFRFTPALAKELAGGDTPAQTFYIKNVIF